MEVITGTKLHAMERFSIAATYRKRFCYGELAKYIHAEYDRKVMSIYGLRRTGKTIMMYQAIHDISDPRSVCFIKCRKSDDMQELKNAIESHIDCRYFFIDEVTNLADFINSASLLADIYAELHGKKIIMAGTDSLGFKLAAREELFDRTYLLHTTYISFKEYSFLLEKNIDEYIQYGGTLTDGTEFYNGETCAAYTDSAIALNIQHSLEYVGRDGKFGALRGLYDSGELTSVINKVVELYNRQFTIAVINKRFKSHDLASLRQLATKRSIIDTTALNADKNENLRQELLKALAIKDPLVAKATPKIIDEIKSYLMLLDVILEVPYSDEVIFTQPGLRYSQASAQAKLLLSSASLPYSATERDFLADILVNDIKGQILEDVIFYQLLKDNTIQEKYLVRKYNDQNLVGEFDVTCVNRSNDNAVVVEVKHSDKQDVRQTKHLNNEAFCEAFEDHNFAKITGKIVIYTGNTAPDKVFAVNYINAGDFLNSSLKILDRMTAICPDIETKYTAELAEKFSNIYQSARRNKKSIYKAGKLGAAQLLQEGIATHIIESILNDVVLQGAKRKDFSVNIIKAAQREVNSPQNKL